MAQIFPNTKKDINLYTQEPQPKAKLVTPKHIVIKLLKRQKGTWKHQKRSDSFHVKGSSIRLSVDFFIKKTLKKREILARWLP